MITLKFREDQLLVPNLMATVVKPAPEVALSLCAKLRLGSMTLPLIYTGISVCFVPSLFDDSLAFK